jgi:hypothetical protein
MPVGIDDFESVSHDQTPLLSCEWLARGEM